MDNLSHARSIIPNQEYLLQGSILDTQVEHLLQRLKGLCDNVDNGQLETFHDHEICFSLRAPNQASHLQLRVRKALDVDAPLQLRYVGQPEFRGSTLVRSSIDVACTATILDFLTELGCRVDFEYKNHGYMFRKGRMKITVSRVAKIGGVNMNESICPSFLVELSILAPTGQDLGEEMRVFAEQLKPLVTLEKIDYKRL